MGYAGFAIRFLSITMYLCVHCLQRTVTVFADDCLMKGFLFAIDLGLPFIVLLLFAFLSWNLVLILVTEDIHHNH